MSRIFLTSLLMFAAQFLFSQTTVNLNAQKDNTIYSDFTTNSNGKGGNFTTGVNRNGGTRRAMIKFDCSSIPAGATVTSVTLTLNLTQSKTGTDNVSLYKLNQDWGEGNSDAGPGGGDGMGQPAQANDATWPCTFSNGVGGCTTSWTTAGGNFVATASATTAVPNTAGVNTWSSTQMKNDVQAWVSNSSTNFGWMIRAGVVAGNESGTQTTNAFASKDNGTASLRPKLSVTYTSGAPVTLLNFKGAENKSGILLNWQTAQEFNNAYFSIEHSVDGNNYASIGKVNGAGTTTLSHSYQFTHQGVGEGKHFYRLAQTDLNGAVHYSNVVIVTSLDKHLQISISPNPVKDLIRLGGIIITPNTTYSIINASGTVVKTARLESNQINADGLTKGYYLLRVNNAGETLSGTFLKQ